MMTGPETSRITLASTSQMSGVRRRGSTPTMECELPESAGPHRQDRAKLQKMLHSSQREARRALVYAVDDAPEMTELYTALLESEDCIVRTFNDRAEALRAFASDNEKPDLLITDYVGHTMSVEQFMGLCLGMRPGLRILMASGICQSELNFSRVKPDFFLQKPFANEEFTQAVRAALMPLGMRSELPIGTGGKSTE
jgi:CheY-like chemotaxis protein